MAKFTIPKGGYTIIPEGVYIFKITEVDDSKYEDFGKLVIRMTTKDGQTHQETYTFIDKNGERAEKAVNAFGYFAKTALNNFKLDDCKIDTDELKGCYVQGRIEHSEYEKNDGSTGTGVHLKDFKPAFGFDAEITVEEKGTPKKPVAKKQEVEKQEVQEDVEDLEDFLNAD